MSFKKAEGSVGRAKIMIFGESGVGKTTFGMRWSELGGKMAVIDLEDGTHRYDQEFEFDRWDPTPTCMQDVMDAIDWLITQEHEYTTLMIDPVGMVWDFAQAHWEKRFLQTRKSGKSPGHHGDHYEIQPADWRIVKAFYRRFFHKLREMDLNVICTARAKPKYAEGAGAKMMQREGTTFDSEKGTNYEMDTVLHMRKLATGQRIVDVEKHRSFRNPMPDRIDITEGLGIFLDHFGDAIKRKAEPIEYATEETIREIKLQLGILDVIGDKERQYLRKLGVASWQDMPQKRASDILAKLTKKADAKVPF